MRCLGEFVGQIMKAVTSNSRTREVGRQNQEVVRGNITLRRTTIDEIEGPEEEIHRD